MKCLKQKTALLHELLKVAEESVQMQLEQHRCFVKVFPRRASTSNANQNKMDQYEAELSNISFTDEPIFSGAKF